ncbi:MAG TPA: hypothetical protein ENN19_03335 [Chloroflexi bacterium]|nr:hypothetical protein [Chloroflexota bacterium]
MIVNRLTWQFACVTITVALSGALVLIGALALGWNSPRPSHPPDWRAPGLPRDLEASPGETSVTLLETPGDDSVSNAGANFTAEMTAFSPDADPLDFNGYGLLYRAQDPANYYVFAVGSDGYYAVLRVVDGAPTPLLDWRQFTHVRRGAGLNRLRLHCDEAVCYFYVNDEYATSVEDDAWLHGQVGLWAWGTGEQSTWARFRDVRIWR